MANQQKPFQIKFDSIVLNVNFHPDKDVIAAGDIDGNVMIYSYDDEANADSELLLALSAHDQSCRAVQFIPDSSKLCTSSKDASTKVFDTETVQELHNLKNPNGTSIYSMLVVSPNIIASGDDDGRLSVWDLRSDKLIMDVKENDDFISDMIIDDNRKMLIATSGDGTLSAFDIRKHKMKVQSELFDSDLLSLAVVKNGTKVVCGTGEGVLNIFNWGEWGNISDRFPGHPMSVDCVRSVGDTVICTGSSDGLVRAVGLFPHRFLGVVGQHEDFLIESLSVSRCGRLLASSSHDEVVKFWNVDPDSIKQLSKQTSAGGKRKATSNFKSSNNTRSRNVHAANAARASFFADLAPSSGGGAAAENSSNSSSDSDDSDDNSDDSDSD